MLIGFDVAILGDLISLGLGWEMALRCSDRKHVCGEGSVKNEVHILKMIFKLCFASYVAS